MAVVVFILLVCVVWLTWKLYHLALSKSPLDNLPGPIRHSFLTGDMIPLFDRVKGMSYQQQLSQLYGSVVKVHGLLGSRILYVSDSKALQYIFRESSKVIHPPFVIASHTVMLGPGLLSTEGPQHRMQRKMLNPVFTPNVMRGLTPLFFQVAYELRDAMLVQLQGNTGELDVLNWMGHAALEAIGRAGMGHSFISFAEGNTPSDAVMDAVKRFVPSIFSLSTLRLFADRIEKVTTSRFRKTIALILPSEAFQTAKYCIETLETAAKSILAEKRTALKHGHTTDSKADILEILLEANRNGSNDSRLSEEELVAQIRTFIFAGTDTTSNALSRVLQTLAENPDAQERLRKEIWGAKASDAQDIAYERLMDIPYLDAVCRETLRLYPPVNFALRQTVEDVVVPTSTPIRGVDGTLLNEFMVPKGTQIIPNFIGSNLDRAVWGEDALEWKPERWFALPETVIQAHIPGVLSHLMSFGGGAHSCIGYRFAVLQMKIVLFVIIDALRFSSTGQEIVWNFGGINFPSMGHDEVKPSLIMRVESVGREEMSG